MMIVWWGMLMVFVLAAAVAQAQDFEILEYKYREIERSENYVTVAWLVKIKNNTSTAYQLWVNIQFVDKDGFELDSDSEKVVLQPNDVTTATDTIMISISLYPQIANMKVSLSR